MSNEAKNKGQLTKYASLASLLLVVGILFISGCTSQEKNNKALHFQLGPQGIETKNVQGDWALQRIQLGVTNVGTESIPSFEMKFELRRDDQVIDEKRVGPWQGIPPDNMRAYSVESLNEEDPYILVMADPQPGSYKIHITAYDSRSKEKVGEADIPFEIKTQ